MSLSAVFVAFAMQGSALPLPQRADIPRDHSTVICPDEASASRMFNQYYRVKPAPNNHNTSTELFFEGLRATGCRQDSPDSNVTVIIQKVLARRTVNLATSNPSYILYRGVNANGKPVIGIVDETSNNKHPRNDYERWLAEWAPDGRIQVTQQGDTVYICPSLNAARAAVRAIPVRGNDKVKAAAFARARTANRCTRAPAGRYQVTARHENRTIDCGLECYDEWNALAATDARRRPVALIYDGSHF